MRDKAMYCRYHGGEGKLPRGSVEGDRRIFQGIQYLAYYMLRVLKSKNNTTVSYCFILWLLDVDIDMAPIYRTISQEELAPLRSANADPSQAHKNRVTSFRGFFFFKIGDDY